MKDVLLASANLEKIEEIKKILGDLDDNLKSLLDFDEVLQIEETGSSFYENAKIKVDEAYKVFKIPVVADDSGLVVDQLNGAPGIYSARYAGNDVSYHQNNLKLLEDLKNFPEPHKSRYHCTAVFFDGKDYKTTEGNIEGKIIKEFRGTNGFGYDPIFVPDGYDKTMAEFSSGEKNSISHRKIAFEEMKEFLK